MTEYIYNTPVRGNNINLNSSVFANVRTDTPIRNRSSPIIIDSDMSYSLSILTDTTGSYLTFNPGLINDIVDESIIGDDYIDNNLLF